MGKDQHVVPKDGKWQVKGAGNEKATATFDTQAEAIEKAREKNSYGKDPYPPKG